MKFTPFIAAFAIAASINGCLHRRLGPPAPDRAVLEATTVESLSPFATDTLPILVVVVRNVDAPERAVSQASVCIMADRGDPRLSGHQCGLSDENGLVTIERAGSGDRTIEVRRLGYAPFRFLATLRDNCRHQAVEIYIGQQAVCLFECTPTPGRAVLTTCRRLPNER